jgi:TPR repeat protein
MRPSLVVLLLVAGACARKEEKKKPPPAPETKHEPGESPEEREAAKRARTPTQLCEEAGDSQQCVVAAQQHLRGEGVPKDEKRGRELLDRACKLKVARGCELLAGLLREGHGPDFPPDPGRANRLMNDACEHGSGDACRQLGMDAMKQKDFDVAAPLLERACELRVALGCLAMGNFHTTGSGVERDPDAARDYYRKACSLGERVGCDKLIER